MEESKSANIVSFEEFKKNPLLYLLFLPLIAMVSLFFILRGVSQEQLEDKNSQIADRDKQIQYHIKRVEKVDSINHTLFEALGAKKVIETVNEK